MKFKYRIRRASYALSKTILPGISYSLNPYIGCYHACIYCYARKYFLMRNIGYNWGEYVEVKINLPNLLEKQLKKIPSGSVIGIGTSCDPYQPLESKFKLTRGALKTLSEREDLKIEVQTKSTLVIRDLYLLKEMKNTSIGFTIITIDDELGKFLEPKAQRSTKRIKVLRRLSQEGINTWIYVGPILPYITDSRMCLERIVEVASKIGVKKILSDRLRFRLGVRESLVKNLSLKWPSLAEKYRNLNEKELMIRYRKAVEILSKKSIKHGLEFEESSLN